MEEVALHEEFLEPREQREEGSQDLQTYHRVITGHTGIPNQSGRIRRQPQGLDTARNAQVIEESLWKVCEGIVLGDLDGGEKIDASDVSPRAANERACGDRWRIVDEEPDGGVEKFDG